VVFSCSHVNESSFACKKIRFVLVCVCVKYSHPVALSSFQVWQPGVDALEEGEELQFDPEAYNYLRGFSIGWPCLR
jgi:hypothetical protein